MMQAEVVFSAVEGPVDESVVLRLLEYAGMTPGPVYGNKGKVHLMNKLAGYNNAARLNPWLVLVDLDTDKCAPTFVATHLPSPSGGMLLRVAVREVEAWFLADHENVAVYLGVPVSKIPLDAEGLPNPKQTVVNLDRHSRRRGIREDMVPDPESGREVGPAYWSRMIEFALDYWDPEVAAQSSDSLRRCVQRLQELAAQSRDA